jgi:hypothetical protein
MPTLPRCEYDRTDEAHFQRDTGILSAAQVRPYPTPVNHVRQTGPQRKNRQSHVQSRDRRDARTQAFAPTHTTHHRRRGRPNRKRKNQAVEPSRSPSPMQHESLASSSSTIVPPIPKPAAKWLEPFDRSMSGPHTIRLMRRTSGASLVRRGHAEDVTREHQDAIRTACGRRVARGCGGVEGAQARAPRGVHGH